MIMEISTSPYLIKFFTAQATHKSDTNNNNITHTHKHTHTHTHTHTSSFKGYVPPKCTYQKAENQTTGASFALSLSLSLSLPPSPLAHAQMQVTCSLIGGKVG